MGVKQIAVCFQPTFESREFPVQFNYDLTEQAFLYKTPILDIDMSIVVGEVNIFAYTFTNKHTFKRRSLLRLGLWVREINILDIIFNGVHTGVLLFKSFNISNGIQQFVSTIKYPSADPLALYNPIF